MNRQLDEDFMAWYQIYPKHKGRAAALNSYKRARKNGATAEDLLAGAQRYAAERKGQDPQYTKMPATWLNQGCWEDEYEPQAAGNPWSAEYHQEAWERLKAQYAAPVKIWEEHETEGSP
ncbi:hypothetical protein ACIQCM_08785 [Pseudarthrobacter sp. NPDC092439]|uniref:hypothetical protein n=1 Tax=unclassified Pseudarthrobacter TaxID=2647000 RepID=UPI0037F74CC6